MKCSLIRPALCATSGQPGIGHITVFGTQGKSTTYEGGFECLYASEYVIPSRSALTSIALTVSCNYGC